jgi:hypothetical protein
MNYSIFLVSCLTVSPSITWKFETWTSDGISSLTILNKLLLESYYSLLALHYQVFDPTDILYCVILVVHAFIFKTRLLLQDVLIFAESS